MRGAMSGQAQSEPRTAASTPLTYVRHWHIKSASLPTFFPNRIRKGSLEARAQGAHGGRAVERHEGVEVNKTAFEELLASVKQATEGARRTRATARSWQINALTIKELRSWTKLSQPEFATLLGVELSTLRNWEQGRREPAGPARALLRAIRNDPANVIRALGRAA